MADAPDALYAAPVSPAARMVGALLWRHAKHGDPSPFVWIATSTIAEMTGQTRQAVGRQLGALMREGLIVRGRRFINGKWFDGWSLVREPSGSMAEPVGCIDATEEFHEVEPRSSTREPYGSQMEPRSSLGATVRFTEAPMKPQEAPLKPSAGAGGETTIETVREGSADGAERMSRELYDAGRVTWGVLVERRGQREAAYDRNRRREYEDAVSDGQKPSRILLAVESLDPWWLGKAPLDEYKTGAPPSLPATWANVLKSPEDHIARAAKAPKPTTTHVESAPMFDLPPSSPKLREWAERMAQQTGATDG